MKNKVIKDMLYMQWITVFMDFDNMVNQKQIRQKLSDTN